MRRTESVNILADSTNTAAIRKSIVHLAWPAILRFLLQTLVGIADVIMIGQLGARAIAAIDVSNRLIFVTIGTLMAMTVGTTALVGHHIGAGQPQKANDIMWQSLVGGTLLAVTLASLGIIFSKNLLKILMILMERADPYILNQGSIYLSIVFASMIFGVPMFVMNAVLQGIGDMKTPLYIMLVTNLTNVAGNYLLIFGIGFFPRLGVTGAALATGLSRVVGTLIGITVLVRGRSGIKLAAQTVTWKIDWPILRDILRIGIPAALEQLVRQSSQIIYTALVASLGTLTLAANAIVMNVQSLSFVPGFGFGTAATTLVAQSLGAQRKDLAEEYGKQSSYLAAALMSLVGLFFLLAAPMLVELYTDNPQVTENAVRCLRIVALVQPMFAIVFVLAGALRGAGDTKWVMYITAIGNWGVRLMASLLFAFVLKLGLMGFWLAMALDVTVRFAVIRYRYTTGAWKTLKVMRSTAEARPGMKGRENTAIPATSAQKGR